MKHINLVNKLILGAVGVVTVGVFTACEKEFYTDEQYRKEIYIVSGDENIFKQEVSFGQGEGTVGYLSIYAGGTTPIENEVTVQLETDEATLQEYNKKRYGESYDKYAQVLPASRYSINDWTVKLYPNEEAPYSLFPIRMDVNGLEPEETYFLPLKIASVSDYMISAKRQNVLLQVFVKNDYATTKNLCYYNMTGTSLKVAKDTWEPLEWSDKDNKNPKYNPINASKLVAPVAEHGIRILTGSTMNSDRKELRKQGVVVTVHPEEELDVDVIGTDGLPTGEKVKCQKVTLDKWYDVEGGITVLNIDDKPSYYNPKKKEFTLNYRYNYKSNDWFEMKEVMTPMDIANKN